MILLLLIAFILFPAYVYGAEETLPPHMMWRVINFVIFVAFMYYVLRKPVSSFFKSRKEKVWKETDDAKKSYEEAMRMLKEIEEKLSQVDNEIEKIVSLNRAIGEKEKKNILEKLKDMIEIIERSGNLEKGIMEKKVRREIVMNIVEQAIKKTKRNLIEKMDVSLHRKINEKSLAALKDAVK